VEAFVAAAVSSSNRYLTGLFDHAGMTALRQRQNRAFHF
jgi:hypothetical protein